MDRNKEISFSSYFVTRSQRGVVADPRCFSTKWERKMGLIVQSGCIKADMGSQVAWNSPWLSHKARTRGEQ